MSTFYNQDCPVCGRTARVPVSLLGTSVCCQHCSGVFLGSCEDPTPHVEGTLLERAERLLRHLSLTGPLLINQIDENGIEATQDSSSAHIGAQNDIV